MRRRTRTRRRSNSKTTSYGGYGYGFTGPNPNLKPEFAKSYEFGTELSFLNDRLGIDATIYRKQTQNQIVQNIRGSYATGFILFNLNGASTRNHGHRARRSAARRCSARNFSWDVLANFDAARTARRSRCRTRCRSPTCPTPGCTATSATARRRVCPRCRSPACSICANNKGQLLIDPTSGLPLRSTTFIDARLRPPAEVHRRPDEQRSGTSAFALELPLRLPERRRRLQRHRALPDDARPRHEHARPQHAARHPRRAARRQGEHRQSDAEQHRRHAGASRRRTTRT